MKVGVPAAAGIRPLSDAEFALFRKLIYHEAGIHLSLAKKALLVGRLTSRVRELGLSSFRQYYYHVTRGPDPGERALMVERMCTHETHFFREPRQFDFLARHVIPQWKASAAQGRRGRRIRAWSAACSTGQEPFSLAMLLLSHLPADEGWSVEVTGTDISRRALAVAEAATWPIARLPEIPDAYRKRFMLKGVRSQEGRIRASPELRGVVRFRQHNLNAPEYALGGAFDLVLCRNVLIYFDDVARQRVVEKLGEQLARGGYLLVGHAETLHRGTDGLRSVGPSAYLRLGESSFCPRPAGPQHDRQAECAP